MTLNSFQIPLRLALMNGESQFTFQFMKYSQPGTRFVLKLSVKSLLNVRIWPGTYVNSETAGASFASDEKKLIWVRERPRLCTG